MTALEDLEASLDAVADALLVVDRNGRVCASNRALRRMFRLPQTLTDDPEQPGVLAAVLDALREPAAFERTLRDLATSDADGLEVLELKDGRVIEASSRPRRVRGAVGGRVFSLRDVTERTRTEAALRLAEERYRGVVEQSGDGIFVFDSETKIILEANAAFRRMLGYDAREMSTLTIYDFIAHPRASIDLNVAKVLEERQTSVGERQYRRKDGTLVDVDVNASSLAYGGRTALCVVVRDLGRRRQDETRLRLLAHTVESSSEMISVTDLDDRFTFLNGAFLAAYGYAEEEILGRHVMVIDSPRNPPEVRRAIFEDTRHGGFRGELLNRRKDGSEFPISLSTSLVKDRQGRVLGLVGVARDITERRKAEDLRNALYRIADKASIAQDIDELYEYLHQVVNELMDARNFYVAVHDPATDLISFPYFRDEFDPRPEPKSPGKGLTEVVLRTGEPFLCSQELFAVWVRKGELELIGSPSVDWLGVPLKNGAVTYGVVAVQSYDPTRRFGSKEAEILGFVSRHIEAALAKKRAEEARREGEQRFRALSNATFEGIVIHAEGRILEANRALAEMCGVRLEDMAGRSVLDLVAPESMAHAREHLLERSDEPFELVILRRDGSRLTVEVQAKDMRYHEELVRVAAIRDVSERKQLEDQLRQAQKMEAVGRLAGGVAHDFNNLLTTILGYCDLLLGRELQDESLDLELTEIRKAGERAASLTKQLLAFSRKQILAPQNIDLNATVRNMENMLRRIIGEDIELVAVLDPGIGAVLADPGQIEQLIVNLAVNARDAMPEGGTLLISTAGVEGGSAGAGTGRCVMLAISDSGIGMDAETQSHLFEPFFTTKETGKGTGLGLATVYGVVTQAGGAVKVESEPGKGTTFRVYLPEVARLEPREPSRSISGRVATPVPGLPRGATLLLVEDEATVRALARKILEGSGYTLLEAPNGEEALRVAASHEGSIDLLVSDLVMPGMSGQQLANRMSTVRPGMKVLFISGYTDDTVVRKVIADSGVAFLQKPFTAESLTRKVRDTMLGRRSSTQLKPYS